MAKEGKKDVRLRGFLISIIVSLVVNILIFGGLLIAFYDQDLFPEIELVQIQVLPENIEIPSPQEIADNYQETRNVVANRRSRYSEKVQNYGRKSSKAVQADIDSELKALEQEVIDELRAKGIGPDIEEKVEKKDFEKEDDQPREGGETSYSKAVITYDLEGRSDRKLPVPAYRCKNAGTVVVLITADNQGSIAKAEIDASASTNDDCLQEEALRSANASLFTSDLEGKKQSGSITYRFIHQ